MARTLPPPATMATGRAHVRPGRPTAGVQSAAGRSPGAGIEIRATVAVVLALLYLAIGAGALALVLRLWGVSA